MSHGYGKHHGFDATMDERLAQWVCSVPEFQEAMLKAASSRNPADTFHGNGMGMGDIGQWILEDSGLIHRAQVMCAADPFLAFVKPSYGRFWRNQTFKEAGRWIQGTSWWTSNRFQFRIAVRNRKTIEDVMGG